LIRTKTGRNCTRQNLEKLCKGGKLPRSTASASPVRVRAAVLVEEYLANVDQRQAVRERPGVKDATTTTKSPPAQSADPPSDDELPAYTISQQRKAYEQANLLELERKQKEGQLLEREDVERAWANTIGRVKSRIMATASAAKQRIPHLDPEEVEILKDMLREALFELAAEGER
jgi:phage terminase Nu1 subunit (DNA packaging protein)